MAIWCQNLWDELILKNEIQTFRELYKDQSPQFQVFSYDTKNIFYVNDEIKYFEYFPIDIKKWRNFLRNVKNFFTFLKIIKNSDKVIFGWWGIFFDTETWNASNPLKQWLFRAIITKMFQKELIFWGVSIDIKQEKNKNLLKKIAQKADKIFVRDQKSYDFLQNFSLFSTIIPDPVFSDNGKTVEENQKISYLQASIKTSEFQVSDLYKYNFENKTVWLALRSGFLKEEQQTIKHIRDFILKSWGKVMFLPHSFHPSDDQANDKKFLESFVTEGSTLKKNMQEVYDVYQKKHIDFCISMRLHSMILSQVYEIPFVALQYAQKTEIFNK